ncbi:glycosyl transferase [Mycobacterium sp. 852013-50091_SCH5140682]|uniref:glycosyltransferase family 2 protein n=1 Tax=Mycobacterium sp. 852013-50091_SCH5140682 TaxID=1834109 RepID=UPI0007E96FF5|nr:glycosyltransferase family 2 protein [Mycobacterium sp. 852013-50091_SCH5140682]OBC16610.1 glycosyl transferase [Mycobacterium sp. 852013-50091_SCH5140682]
MNAVMRPSVSVVIPALNEERNLPLIALAMPPEIDEIIVVTGDSQDNTTAEGHRLWPSGTHLRQSRRGKGNALACGFAVASGDVIVALDADGSADPAEIPRLVDALVAGADFAKGSRFARGNRRADITWFRAVGNKLLNGLVNILFRAHYTDVCYGFGAFWRHCLDVIDMPDVAVSTPQWGDGVEVETLINVRLAACGARVVEVASPESGRIPDYGSANAISDGLRTLCTVRREFRRARTASRSSAARTRGLRQVERG